MLWNQARVTQAPLLIGWLVMIGGIIGVVLPVVPGWPFLLLGLSILSKRYEWAHRAVAWLRSRVSAMKRRLEGLAKGRRASMLHVEIRRSGDLATLRCTGRIVLGDRSTALRVAVLSQDTPVVRLDLSRINLVDAAGLGALVDLHKRLQHAGKELELANPAGFVAYVLRITRLDSVFHISHGQQSATARPKGKQRWSRFICLARTTLPIVVGLVVFGVGISIEKALTQIGRHGSSSILDDVGAGIVAVIVVLCYEQRRRHHIMEKDRVNRLMNHHVREALQVITYSIYTPNSAQQRRQIEASIARIEWSLREVLPGEAEADSNYLRRAGTGLTYYT